MFGQTISHYRILEKLAFAYTFSGLGDKDQAFLWLEKAYEERASTLTLLGVEPMWEPLRSDPRFADLVRRVRIPSR